MPLSETDALTLLRTHCNVLRHRLVFDVSRDDGALITQVWMSLLCLRVTETDLAAGLGYELRVAMDVVNSLCSCRGFAPDRNHPFWRTAVSELWIEYSDDIYDQRRTWCPQYLFQPPTHMMLPFDSAAFSCFSIDFQEFPASGFEATLGELWRQVTWTEAAKRCPEWIMKRRQVAMEQLVQSGSHVRPIRTLQVELLVPRNGVRLPDEGEMPELLVHDWSILSRALDGIGQAVPLTRASSQELLIALHPD